MAAQPPEAPWPQQIVPQQLNEKAAVAMVMGIAGLTICPVVLSIPAVILGYQSRREIDESMGRQSGRGFAIAGIVLGWVGIALAIISILVLAALIVFGLSFESETTTGTDGTFTVNMIRMFM
jgi:hypothetical protein